MKKILLTVLFGLALAMTAAAGNVVLNVGLNTKSYASSNDLSFATNTLQGEIDDIVITGGGGTFNYNALSNTPNLTVYAQTNGGWWDLNGRAHDATNALGAAAWQATGAFDAAGAAAAAVLTYTPTNDATWFDAKGAAFHATNNLGTAAWQASGAFDAAGAGTTAAQQATNNLGTAAWQATGAFDAAGAGTTAAQHATNGLLSTNGNASGLTGVQASNLVSGGQIPVGTLFDVRTNDPNSLAYMLWTDATTGKRHATTDAGALTNLNASAIGRGTLPDARLSSRVMFQTESYTTDSIPDTTMVVMTGAWAVTYNGLWVTNNGTGALTNHDAGMTFYNDYVEITNAAHSDLDTDYVGYGRNCQVWESAVWNDSSDSEIIGMRTVYVTNGFAYNTNDTQVLTNTVATGLFTGTFSGSFAGAGSNLTGVPASSIPVGVWSNGVYVGSGGSGLWSLTAAKDGDHYKLDSGVYTPLPGFQTTLSISANNLEVSGAGAGVYDFGATQFVNGTILNNTFLVFTGTNLYIHDFGVQGTNYGALEINNTNSGALVERVSCGFRPGGNMGHMFYVLGSSGVTFKDCKSFDPSFSASGMVLKVATNIYVKNFYTAGCGQPLIITASAPAGGSSENITVDGWYSASNQLNMPITVTTEDGHAHCSHIRFHNIRSDGSTELGLQATSDPLNTIYDVEASDLDFNGPSFNISSLANTITNVTVFNLVCASNYNPFTYGYQGLTNANVYTFRAFNCVSGTNWVKEVGSNVTVY